MNPRISRIAEKLRTARERGLRPFGVEAHGFRMGAPLAAADIAAFEARHAVRLPDGYRAFITQLADGGAGPAYGTFPLKKTLEVERGPMPAGFLARPFPPVAAADPREDPAWDDLWERAERGELTPEEKALEIAGVSSGTLVLCHEGCGYLHLLVVTGPTRGQMWLDTTCSGGDFAPLQVDFLEWYERWLDDTLAGGPGTWWMGGRDKPAAVDATNRPPPS